MTLADQAQALQPLVRRSPLPGFEYVRGFGIFGLPFDSGHVLALRVFPENDFAPYKTIWHRAPDGAWSIFVDGPRLDTACPRYYSAAAKDVHLAKIALTWTGPMRLSVEVDNPRLDLEVTMARPPLFSLMNAISESLPEGLCRTRPMLRAFEWLGRKLFGLGDITLTGNAPNGQFAILMPRRMYPIATARCSLDGVDLGKAIRVPENPTFGSVKLPARGVFAIGRAYFEIKDQAEHDRTVAELAAAPVP